MKTTENGGKHLKMAEFPSFPVSQFPCFPVSQFLSFQVSNFLSLFKFPREQMGSEMEAEGEPKVSRRGAEVDPANNHTMHSGMQLLILTKIHQNEKQRRRKIKNNKKIIS